MKHIGVLAMLATLLAMGCGGDDSNKCMIQVTSIGTLMPNKHLTIMGNFSQGQPLALLQGTDGTGFRQIPCTSAADNMSADCDLSTYPSGTWDLGFGVSCFDNDEGTTDYQGAPMITIP